MPPNATISSLKKRVRNTHWLYAKYGELRAQGQEELYLSLREQYYQKGGAAFAGSGYLAKSLAILRERWSAPSRAKTCPGEVRLFAAGANVVGAAKPLEEIQRSFDGVVFDFGKWVPQIEGGDSKARESLQQEMLAAFREAHHTRPFDLVWLSTTFTFCTPETLHEFRRQGVPVAVFNTDDKHLFLQNPRYACPNGQRPLIGNANVHLTNSLECVRWYLAEGAAAYYCPQGVDPEFFRPLALEKDLDVSFIGAAYGMRRKFVESLRQSGIRVSCFGRDWGTRFVSEGEAVEILNRSRICLGIGGVAYSHRITCIKGRDLEVPGSGNLYLTQYDPELARMWDIGREILCYRDEIDCVEQIRYYLERPDEAAMIGRAARERTLREHTWTHRLNGLLRWMGILA